MTGDDSAAESSSEHASTASGSTATQFPIVLAHGLLGFNKLFGVVEYFNGIPEELTANGSTVFVTSVSAVNSSDVRGEQLAEQIATIVATSGAPKVNLIGHSQGGLDARFVAATRPDLVASITTFGTPHTGTPVADALAGTAQPVNGILTLIVNEIGTVIDLLAGTNNPQDAQGALSSLTTSGAAAFNVRFPAGVPAAACGSGAASAGGITFFSLGGAAVRTNIADPSDLLLSITALLFPSGTVNDGLVGQCSSHFGTVIRDNFQMNHLDEINQVLGLTSANETPTPAVYDNIASRLKGAGL